MSRQRSVISSLVARVNGCGKLRVSSVRTGLENVCKSQTQWGRGGDSNPRCRFTFVSLKLAESGRVFRPEITINSVETMFASSSPKKLSCAAVDRDSEQRNPARGPTGRFHRFKTIALRTAG